VSQPGSLRRLNPVAARILGSRAALAAARAWRRRRTAVLCYHRIHAPTPYDAPTMVVSPAEFQAQLAFLIQHCEIVRARDAVRPGDGPRVAITFDDGYRELLETALPALAEVGAPSTVFCCSAVVAGGSLWWDQLEAAVRAAPPGEVEVPVGGRDLKLELEGEESRARAHRALFGACATERRPETAAQVAIAALGRVDPPNGLYLRASDLEVVAELGAEVGSHGRTHARLTALSDGAVAAELADSRTELEEAVGAPVDTLAYPYGNRASVGQRVFRAAAEAGYEAAFTGRTAAVRPGASPMSLPRVPVHSGDWPHRFAGKSIGLYPAAYAAAARLVRVEV